MIRIVMPYHLRTLAKVDGEVTLDVTAPITVGSILDALEARYPVLRGTIRDQLSLARRPLVRFFVCERDISLKPTDELLPNEVASGAEPFFIIGAIAGG